MCNRISNTLPQNYVTVLGPIGPGAIKVDIEPK